MLANEERRLKMLSEIDAGNYVSLSKNLRPCLEFLVGCNYRIIDILFHDEPNRFDIVLDRAISKDLEASIPITGNTVCFDDLDENSQIKGIGYLCRETNQSIAAL